MKRSNNIGKAHFLRALTILAIVFAFRANAEVQTTLNMTVPALVMGTSGTFSSSQASGPVGTNTGTVLHSYAGVENFVQTSGTGRFSTLNGTSVFGVGFDTFQIFQSFVDPDYLTVVNSSTTCPVNSTYDWMMVRMRTPDAPRDRISATDPTLTAGGTFAYTASTSTFTGTNYFNLSGPTLASTNSYGISGYNSTVCTSGKNLAYSTGTSSLDQYLYVYYGATNVSIVTSNGNPEVIIATPQTTLSAGTMTSLANYVFTGLYTYFVNDTSQTRANVYLYPNAAGTTYTIKQETSLTDPTQYTTIGTLTCTSLNSPTTGFCSGTLTLSGVTGTGNAVCLVSPNTTENLLLCSAQYPGYLSDPVTIIGKTVSQGVSQVSLPAAAASVASSGQSTNLTATVQNLSSRYASVIGNPTDPALDLSSPWSNTGAFGGGSGTCGTTLKAYSSCTFPVTYTSTGIGTNTGVLRVAYDNGTGTNPNATANLVGTTGLVSLAITPAGNYFGNGSTTQLTVTATYSDSSTQNVTSAVNWSSSNTSAATISSLGLASWVGLGSSTLTASLASVSTNQTFNVVTPPVLTVVSNQIFPSSYLNQGANFTQDFNNISGGSPGNDTNMTYTCVYDQVVDGSVSPGTACTSLPGTISFGSTTGIFNWTPTAGAWGPYEIKVTGTLDTNVSVSEIFVIDVRPGYVTTNLRGDYEAQFANLTSNWTSASYYWDDLTTNAFNGTSSSTTNATWVGNGSYSSPYALTLNGSADMDFGSSLMASQTKMMFTLWMDPTTSTNTDQVILGSSNDGTGNGFNLRQSKGSAGKVDFSVGLEATYTASVSNLTPVAYYRLDETSGTTLHDSSANGYNLTLAGSGTTLNVAGAINGDTDTAIQYNGSGYACNTTSNSLSGTFTVEAWVNPSATGSTYGIVGSRESSDYSFDMSYISGQFHADIGNGTSWLTQTANTTASTYTTLNAWYHVVYVVTPTGYTVYVDGVNAGSNSYTSATPLLFNSSHNLCVGASGSNLNNFKGKIDEVAVYNTALSSTQILNHYNLGRTYFTTVVGDSPTAYWRLGETSGTTLADSTANAYNLTISGSGYTMNQTGAISGDSNGALLMTGASQNCYTGSATLQGTFSVEAWVYPTNATSLNGIVGSRASGDESFDMKYDSGVFHGDIGNGSSWITTAADTAASYTTLNTWYHVVYVVTPTGYTIYVNGTNAGSNTWASATPILFNSTHTLCVGADSDAAFEELSGKLDEVAIYNYALTSTQVANHYNTGINSSAGVTSCTSLSTLGSGVWNAIAGIFDGTNAILYVNGRQECTMTVSGSLTTPASDVIAGATSATSKYWTGSLAELQIYGATGATTVGTAANVNTNFTSTADLFRQTPVGGIVTNGLVLHYDAANATRGLAFPGDGISQTSWFDLSSSILDGTLNAFTGTGTSGWTGSGTASSPYALTFNGSSNYVSTGYTQTSATGYTIEVWVNTTDAGTERTFVNDRGSAGSGSSLTLGIGTTGGGHGGAGLVGWEVDSNSLDIGVSSTTAVNDGKWHQVVGTWSASSGTAVAASQFTIYIDDAAAATTSGSIGSATSPLTGLGGTSIGYHSLWGTYLNGAIAKVAIYNRALAASEVVQNCKAIVGRFSTGVCH